MTAKPRQSQHRRKIFVAPFSTANELARFSDVQWQALEAAIGHELVNPLRRKLYTACAIYALGAGRDSRPVFEVANNLRQWKEITKIRRQAVWRGPKKALPDKIAKKHVNRLLAEAIDTENIRNELAYLSGVMTAAEAAAQFVIQEITSKKFRGTQEYELWMLWVNSVARLLREYNVPVLKAKTSLSPQFVKFIECLLEFFPKGIRRREDHHSILKGIDEAETIVGSSSFSTTVHLLIAEGIFSFPDARNSPLLTRVARFGTSIAKTRLENAAKRRRAKAKKTKALTKRLSIPRQL